MYNHQSPVIYRNIVAVTQIWGWCDEKMYNLEKFNSVLKYTHKNVLKDYPQDGSNMGKIN